MALSNVSTLPKLGVLKCSSHPLPRIVAPCCILAFAELSVSSSGGKGLTANCDISTKNGGKGTRTKNLPWQPSLKNPLCAPIGERLAFCCSFNLMAAIGMSHMQIGQQIIQMWITDPLASRTALLSSALHSVRVTKLASLQITRGIYSVFPKQKSTRCASLCQTCYQVDIRWKLNSFKTRKTNYFNL